MAASPVPGPERWATSVDDVVAFLRARPRAVLVRGTGTKLDWGGVPERVDAVLDVSGLDKVVAHHPGDLVVRAQAGVRLADLQAALAPHGQRLALDPPPGGTLGGIVATNAAGPLRLRFGAPRDLLIGLTIVRSDGAVASAGGRVVKNVAGYDLMKLLCGSFGTLGVLVETIWRVHPVPSATCAVVLRPSDPLAELRRLARSTLTPSAVELAGPPWRLTVLLEGSRPAVQAQGGALAGEVGEVLPGRPDDLGAWPDAPVLVKVAAALSGLGPLLAALPTGARLAHSARVGVGYVGLPDLTGLPRLRAVVAPYDGSAVVLRAPDKSGVDVWGDVGLPDSTALGMMRRVKAQFDPDGVFAAGRFVGGI